MKDKKEKILNLILPLISIVLIIGVWSLAALSIDSVYVLPSVKDTIKALIVVFEKKEFYLALLFTTLRSLLAFAVSFLIAFILAALGCKNANVRRFVSPIIAVTRALPTIAIVLLLLFWTNSKIAPIIVTSLVVFPTVFTNVENALLAVDKTVCDAARVDGADEKKVFRLIELPLIKPEIYSTVGSGFSLNFKLMVAAEVIAQTARSLGYLLNTAKVYFETAEMIALVCVSVFVGVVVESVFNKLSKKARE